MDIVLDRVAGLDVHHKTVVCAVRLRQPSGKLVREVRTFGTMTRDLRALADYLGDHGVTHAAMEATGVLWKPIWNVLEAAPKGSGRSSLTLLLVNPRHLKKVPGRKTDVSDAEWISHLLSCGLLKGSFVPSRAVRNLRDLTRLRAQLADEHTRVANRVHKVLHDANCKLGAVASDVLGKSGRSILAALLDGEDDPEQLAELALGRLRKKIPQLRLALEASFSEHHRFVLRRHLSHLNHLESQEDKLTGRIEKLAEEMLAPDKQARLLKIPGVDRKTMENVLAEIGPDMNVFPDERHLASWTGICPGNEETAGKRLRSRTRKGNRWLRRALSEAAWAASHSKESYLAAQFRRVAARRGRKRALLAVGHSLLTIVYCLLKRDVEYEDLGADWFDRMQPEQLRRYLVRRLERLGFAVTLTDRTPEPALEDAA
jgi:transposase